MISTIPWEEVVAKLGPHHFMVDDLQAVDPADLTCVDGVLVSWSPRERDSRGFIRVEVRAATREAIIDYVRANWGDEDRGWFEAHVAGRIIEVGAFTPGIAAALARTVSLEDAIKRGKREIAADVAGNRVPSSVATFSDLHDYVDANEYGGICDTYSDADDDFVNAVQNALDAWIKAGRPQEGRRRHLVVRYDVTDLTQAEVDYLSGELHAMAEATSDGADGHPDVPVISLDEVEVAP